MLFMISVLHISIIMIADGISIILLSRKRNCASHHNIRWVFVLNCSVESKYNYLSQVMITGNNCLTISKPD